MNEQVHYLDHAATTPMVPAAIEAMTEHLRDVGNASSLHASGRRARRVVEESRETIAQALNCRPGEVVFTSGGTESDNLALKGIHWSRTAVLGGRPRLVSSAIEHHAVLDPLDWLQDGDEAEVPEGWEAFAGRVVNLNVTAQQPLHCFRERARQCAVSFWGSTQKRCGSRTAYV